jgi:AraC-like DNA-binding protein
MPRLDHDHQRGFEAFNNLLRLEIDHAAMGPIRALRWVNRIPGNRIFFIHRVAGGGPDGGTIRILGPARSAPVPLRAGRIYYLPGHQEIEGIFREGLFVCGFHFRLEAFPGLDVFAGEERIRELDGHARAIAEVAEFSGRELDLSEIARMRGLVLAAAALFIERGVEDLRRLEALRGRYRPVFDALEAGSAAQISVKDLARAMGMRRERLSREFARDLGMPLKAYLLRHLVGRVCERLAASDERVSDIAREFGFASDTYFCRFLRRHAGRTPLRYRRMRQRWDGYAEA